MNFIESYLKQKNWKLKESANFQYNYDFLRNYIANKEIRSYWLNKVFTKRERDLHLSGDIHIHDLDNLCPYCIGWDTASLLTKLSKDLNPNNSLDDLLERLFTFLSDMSREWAGAQSLNNFDSALAPYLEIYATPASHLVYLIKKLFTRINTLQPLGKSLFTNFSLDLQPSKEIFIKKRKDFEISEENLTRAIELIDNVIFDTLIERNVASVPFVFPLITINITDDFDWNALVLNKIMLLSLKYGSPYFQNFVGTKTYKHTDGTIYENVKFRDHTQIRSMCCRLRLDLSSISKRQGIFSSSILTGSSSVVTINLPRIGYLARNEKRPEEYVYAKLEKILKFACNILRKRERVYKELFGKGLFPHTKVFLKKDYKNHFKTIGIVGMNEFIQNLYKGNLSFNSEEAKKLSLDILRFINAFLENEAQNAGGLYNLEATPAEGACYSLARKDKAKFSKIITAGSRKNIYYTNSSQLPANYSDDIFLMAEHQERLQAEYTGGSVFHIYFSSPPLSPNHLTA